MSDIQEQQENADQVSEVFTNLAQENQDELLDELDEMMAEDAMAEMDGMADAGSSAIP